MTDMTGIFKWLYRLPLFKMVFGFGVLVMTITLGVNVPWIDVDVPGGLSVLGFGAGFILIVFSIAINEQNKTRDLERQKMDKDFRETKIKAGLDPADDKTVYKIDNHRHR